MGYSQLWEIKSQRRWRLAWPRLISDTQAIVDAADIDLTSDRIWDIFEVENEYGGSDEARNKMLCPPPPLIDENKGIILNGIHNEGCEPFVLSRVSSANDLSTCKANRRPYDIVVCAILIRAKQLLGNAFYAVLPTRADAEREKDGWHRAYALIDLLWPKDNIPEESEDPWVSDNEDSDFNGHIDRSLQQDRSDQHGERLTGLEGTSKVIASENHMFQLDIPKEFLNTAIGWIQKCDPKDSAHRICHPIASQSRSLLLRFIDVERRCIVAAPQDTPYVALSYVWGRTKQLRLLDSNMDQLMKDDGLGKYEAEMAKTIREAAALCQRLGYRYLWADALCILQDNSHDKVLQLNKMREIYSNASLTIVAASGDDANSGLVNVEANIGSFDSIESPDILSQFLEILSKTTWDTRGWTLQEKVLSRRILLFSPDGLYFVCGSLIQSQKGFQRLDSNLPQCDRPGELFNIDSGKQLETYLGVVQRYSKRNLTVESDYADAMKGITKAFGHSLDGRSNAFFQGIPTAHFDELFCWRTTEHEPQARRAGFRSWSWHGWKQTPIFPDHIIDKVKWKRTLGCYGSHMLAYDRTLGNDGTGLNATGINSISDLNPLMLSWTGGTLEVDMVCFQDVGTTNGLFRVFSPINGQEAGVIQLHKEWREKRPARLEFLPVLTEERQGSVRVKVLMCLELSQEPSRNMSGPDDSFERVQLMDCDIAQEDWNEMIRDSPSQKKSHHLCWVF